MEITEESIKNSVRYDPESKMFCVVDAIMLVQGCTRNAAKKSLARIMDDEIYGVIFGTVFFDRMKGKSAPACTFSVLCEVLALLPGKTAREFRGHAMRTFARALGGDLSLAADIERRAARLAGTELQGALLEGTGAPPPSILDVPTGELERALVLLEPEDPDVARAAAERTLDVDAFFEATFVLDPYGCAPSDLVEPLVRHREFATGVDKKTRVSRAFLSKMCSDRGLVLARQRRFWNGAWSTREWILGAAFADPAKCAEDARKVGEFRRAVANAEYDLMGPIRSAAAAHVRALVASDPLYLT
jgi:hypothetical protein